MSDFRYSRQILFWPNHELDQEKLKDKTVGLIGVGALGTVAANHLVRSGIGTLRLVDRDFVEMSNLQRQMLFDENDVAQHLPKVIAASHKLKKINSEVKIESYVQDVNASTIESLVEHCDVIIDATDNMETRFLINDVSTKFGIPWIYGGAIHARGMFTPIIPGETPCLQCLFPGSYHQHGDTCDTVGVLGPLVHIIAAYQVTEAIKLLLGYNDKLNRQLTQIDTWSFDIDEIPVEFSHNPECSCCVKHEFNYLNREASDSFVSQLCGRDSIQIAPAQPVKIDFKQWEKKWKPLGPVIATPFLLRLDYGPYQLTLFEDGRLLVKGTQEPSEAKSIYSKLIGN